jgi:uncharacterized protein
MTILDANVLLYNADLDVPGQPAVRRWLKELLDSRETIGLPWLSIWAFVRVSTNTRVWNRPLSPKDAFARIADWLAQPDVIVVQPGPRHAEILEGLMTEYAASGPLITDAVLAALTLEYGARLASTDQDFRRFPTVKWINPLKAG